MKKEKRAAVKGEEDLLSLDQRSEKYDGRSLTEHIYQAPDMFLGNDEQQPKKELLYDPDSNTLVLEVITLPEAINRLFLEAVSNASDNECEAVSQGLGSTPINVRMDDHTIIVRNGGNPIPVCKHKSGLWTPEYIFGSTLTSSNYKKIRHGAGRNGLGSKLINIFSTEFSVTVGDPEARKQYRQVWRDNMKTKTEPVITTYRGPSFVEVSYVLDMKRFGYDEYPDEAYNLFARHCADLSFTTKTEVTFNDLTFHLGDIQDYARLVCPEYGKHLIYRAESEDSILPAVDLMILDTPDQELQVSFVNSLMTKDGGVHVKKVLEVVSRAVVAMVNGPTEKKDNTSRITPSDVTPHITIILAVRVENPKFNSQSKTALDSPKITLKIPKKDLEALSGWDLIQRLRATLRAKDYKLLTASDGTRREPQLVRGEDANFAIDPAQCHRATLFIVEGNAGMGYPVGMLEHIPGGRDVVGILPMKGKPLNVTNAPVQQIADNKEIAEMKRMIGLREGMDYTDEENRRTLRYGSVVILADADVDGKHITGLILNYLHLFYPSLFEIGMIHYTVLPILRMKKGSKEVKFFSEEEYRQWCEETADYQSWSSTYYKGLGSSSAADIADDMTDPKYVCCLTDDKSCSALALAFNKDLTDHRKDWIASWSSMIGDIKLTEQSIHDYVNLELIKYEVANLYRSIPSVMDGLKPSQRKIIWAAFDHWGWKAKSSYSKFKVEQFAMCTAQLTKYQHGGLSLEKAIVSMTQSFVGSNNMPYFTEDGQFGTRNKGGKDAAPPRYPSCQFQPWMPYVFKEADLSLLEILEDEGCPIEPKFFLPILPMHLINGCSGIGTGHSTFIPCHNPEDCVAWLRAKLRGEETTDLTPWYRNFKGTIEVVEVTAKKKSKRMIDPAIEDALSDLKSYEETDEDEVGHQVMITRGVMNVKHGNVTISELPIGRWTSAYNQFLEELKRAKKIKKKSNRSDCNNVLFKFQTPELLTDLELGLQKKFGLGNMILLGPKLVPSRYEDSTHLIEEFYFLRLPYYQKRKDLMATTMREKIDNHNFKAKFIELVRSKVIKVYRRNRQQIFEDMTTHEIPELYHANLVKIPMIQFTEEKVQTLQKQREALIAELAQLNQVTAAELWLRDLEQFLKVYLKMK